MSVNTQARPARWVFWAIYAVVALLLLRAVPQAASMMELMGNDDLVRLVEIRDWMNGQGWADLMQYRMGPDGGTLMHWSRLVDAPIAAIIWFAERVLPQYQAEAVAMVVWPLGLAGGMLAILRSAGRALGGEYGGNFAMLLGGLAILSTGKFDAGSFDHHNLQLMAIMLALTALLAHNSGLKSGMVAGVASAISLAIGFEGLLFVAVLGVYVALLWVATGHKARAQALGFSGAFAGALLVLYALLWPSFAATAFRCDAFGLDLLRVGVAAGLGLAGLVAIGGSFSLGKRVIGVAVLAVFVVGFTMVVSPFCLTNPLGQLSPDVATVWLGAISEAKPLLSYVQSHSGQKSGLILAPFIAMGIAIWVARDRRYTAGGLLMLAMVVVAYGLTLYQIRGENFLMLLAVPPTAVGLARLYGRYRTGNQRAIVAVFVLFVLSLPDVMSMIVSDTLFTKADMAKQEQAAPPAVVKACTGPASFAQFSTASPGMVLANTNLGAYLLAYTPHRVLTSNFHRNNAGIQAGIDIARAAPEDVPALLNAFGVRYVVYCTGQASPFAPTGQFPNGLWARLQRHDVPAYLKPLSQDGLVVLEFIPEKDP